MVLVLFAERGYSVVLLDTLQQSVFAAASGDLCTTDEPRRSTSTTQKFSITLLLYSTSPSFDAAQRSLGTGGDGPSLRAGERGSREFR
jgi:hypothetical protein